MDSNAFTAGVKPGGLKNDYEIKILICYMLHNLREPVTFERLSFALQNERLVNYFELAAAFNRLVSAGNIIIKNEEGEERIFLTDIGVKTAVEFEKTLPLTVREDALSSFRKGMMRRRIEANNAASYKKTGDGYEMTLSIPDMGTDLLKMTFFVPTKERCEQIKKNFLQDPTLVYRAIISILTGEEIMEGSIYDRI